MARKHSQSSPSPGPSTKALRTASPLACIERMVIDPSEPMVAPTGMDFLNDELSSLAQLLTPILDWRKLEDDDFSSDAILPIIHGAVLATLESRRGDLVNYEQFKKNATKTKIGASSFTELMRKAIKNPNDLKFWRPVAAHDIFYLIMPDDPSEETRVTRELQEEVVTRSWQAPFIGEHALEALKLHVVEQKKKWTYGPYCSIVQSSGMGKSRLLDEFSRTNFLIPINLRKPGTDGFPPPDDAIRDLLLTQFASGVKSGVYSLMLHFLLVLFKKTKHVITTDLNGAKPRSECITRFRNFMTDGQTMTSVGDKRRKFYDEIAVTVREAIKTSEATPQQVRGALNQLIGCLGPVSQTGGIDKFPDVFIVFDEADALMELKTVSNRSYFIELRSVLHDLGQVSFFAFFLSTTSTISRFMMPRVVDRSSRMVLEELEPSLPFSDLGFDHLMHNRKIFDKFKTIDDVTSTECVVYMGRPLWGTIYDYSDERTCGSIIPFAIKKLLCNDDDARSLSFSADQHCAVLSQRLALDINSTTYVTGKSTRNYDMLDKVQLQIANHMRVRIATPDDLTSVRGVAASEPLLSEAASHIMRNYTKFNLPDALLNILDSYAISHGDQGELLVAVFFTWARDLYVLLKQPKLFPDVPTPFCPVFSVMDLLSNLFQAGAFSTMSDSFPSVCRPDFPSQKFGVVFKNTKMHFNHMIQPFRREVITRPYLLTIMARGAAALGANCQPGFDMVYPYLYETSDLIIKNVGFVIVQVENHTNHIAPTPALFRRMDPYFCQLLDEDGDHDPDLSVPIIRIVFSIGEDKPSLEPMAYKSPGQGVATFDADGHPRFTSYDFWCSGIGPNLLRPVENNAQTKWETLLGKTSGWDGLFLTSKAYEVRCSQYPAGGTNDHHFNAWTTPNIPLDSV
ncbi:hypothetical protein EDB83DRAFT_2283085 [Lactarius deliciosus]|nr:hypothetical protein EDB83DRAFT_2283085 [Lactarius deliciosus]